MRGEGGERRCLGSIGGERRVSCIDLICGSDAAARYDDMRGELSSVVIGEPAWLPEILLRSSVKRCGSVERGRELEAIGLLDSNLAIPPTAGD